MDLLKLAGIAVQSQQVSSEPSCGDGMGESEGAGFDEATTEPNPAEFPDGISTLGSVSDTSLRRYLKARGDHVTVDEDIYPDYAVEDVAESYKAFAEKAKNPYAVGMAQAMKSTGDEPPLKKSTIKKAHDIAKAVDEAAKPDFLDIDKDGNKKEPMKKAAKDKKQVGEAAKPDYIDIDGDGDKKEPMKKAAKDKEETKANESLNYLKKLAGVA